MAFALFSALRISAAAFSDLAETHGRIRRAENARRNSSRLSLLVFSSPPNLAAHEFGSSAALTTQRFEPRLPKTHGQPVTCYGRWLNGRRWHESIIKTTVTGCFQDEKLQRSVYTAESLMQVPPCHSWTGFWAGEALCHAL